MEKADYLYRAKAYPDALKIYERLVDKDKRDPKIHKKIANTYYKMREMPMAVSSFERYEKEGGQFNQTEILSYARAMQSTGNYEESINLFQKYLDKNPDDREVLKIIWQLENIKYLYEDSVFFKINPLPINTSNDELCPSIYDNSIIFISNRNEVETIKRIDATDNKPFFDWYISNRFDQEDKSGYTDVKPFGASIQAKYHKGSICFFPSGDSMIFARIDLGTPSSHSSTSQLFFAKKEGKNWIEYAGFQYNSDEYSIDQPALSEDGNSLYFSSDMPGGYGSMDLYRSDFINGKWSRPYNLGKEINTTQNEKYPFIRDNMLYFTSDGQPGFGGLDIFMAAETGNGFEVSNMGSPVNTRFDDFGFVLDKEGSFGYLASNRYQQNNNDNIFEVYISRPNYPLLISGIIRYKNSNLKESLDDLNHLANAKLELIDIFQKEVVGQSVSDDKGYFKLEIPYESQFKLRVSQHKFGVAVVSMEIPKNPEDYLNHEIVIVKELFSNSQLPDYDTLTQPDEETLIYDQ
jgi:tetratricopeptide (TPR) repeat protein